MNNMYFLRKEKGKIPFKKAEIITLLSEDFELKRIWVNDHDKVKGFTVIYVKYPKLIDPISEGIELSLQEDGGYSFDPRFFKDDEKFKILFDQILPDLMTDLELDYDDDQML